MLRRLQIALWVAVGLAAMVLVWTLTTSQRPVDLGLKDAERGWGETEAGVIARFGPPGSYASQPRDYEFFRVHGQWPPSGSVRSSRWYDDFATVEVFFTDDGRVAGWYRAKARPPLSMEERLRRWFNRP
ncbi:MAG: hypothetical protein K8U57_12940 [Planctomycetes bacterium]|nr:hypothetical protein [Planctomycetota bacterium]